MDLSNLPEEEVDRIMEKSRKEWEEFRPPRPLPPRLRELLHKDVVEEFRKDPSLLDLVERHYFGPCYSDGEFHGRHPSAISMYRCTLSEEELRLQERLYPIYLPPTRRFCIPPEPEEES